MKILRHAAIAATIMGVCGLSTTAVAASDSDTFQVKLTIQKACTVGHAGDLDFGSADADSTSNLSATKSGLITVTCSATTPYEIALEPSSGNTDGTGAMSGAASGNTDTVAYALYQDSSKSTKWGNQAGTNTQGGTGTGTQQDYDVYGEVDGNGLNVTPDDYSDTVTVSVSY